MKLMNLLCLSLLPFLSMAKPLVIEYTDLSSSHWYPSIDKMQQVLEQAGIDYVMRPAPAERSLQGLLAGTVDMNFGRVPAVAQAYDEIYQVNVPVTLGNMVVVHTQGLTINEQADLAGLTMVGILNSKGYENFSIQLASGSYVQAPNDIAMFNMINSGRADFTIFMDIVASELVNQLELERAVVTNINIVDLYFYLVVNQTHQPLVAKLERIMTEIVNACPQPSVTLICQP